MKKFILNNLINIHAVISGIMLCIMNFTPPQILFTILLVGSYNLIAHIENSYKNNKQKFRTELTDEEKED